MTKSTAMDTDPIIGRAVELYPKAHLHSSAAHRPIALELSAQEVIRGDAGPVASPWTGSTTTRSTSGREIEVKWRREEVLLIGPRAFIRSKGGAIDHGQGFGVASLEAVRQGPVFFEDDVGWVLVVSADPNHEAVRTWWFDTRPLGPPEPPPEPPLEAWERAGGDPQVAAWARTRLAEAEFLGLPLSWSRLVVAGALHRTRPRVDTDGRALVQAILEGRPPERNAADAVVWDWCERLPSDTRQHYRHVALASAHEIADTLDELAEEFDPDAPEERARVTGVLEAREDVACVFAAVGGSARDFEELSKLDARASRRIDALPIISCARASPRLASASFWDIEGWWLGQLEGEDDADDRPHEPEEKAGTA